MSQISPAQFEENSMDAIPEDLKAIAEQVVADYGHDPKGLLIGAIAAAVYSERERCAKIAEDNNSWPRAGEEIAREIRGEPHHG